MISNEVKIDNSNSICFLYNLEIFGNFFVESKYNLDNVLFVVNINKIHIICNGYKVVNDKN